MSHDRRSCRHLGRKWLRERGLRAGRASAIARLTRIAARAENFPSKTRAFIAGYDRGYRAAYKRHFEYWQKRLAFELIRRAE